MALFPPSTSTTENARAVACGLPNGDVIGGRAAGMFSGNPGPGTKTRNTQFSKTNGLTEEFSVWSLTSVGPLLGYLQRQFSLHSLLWRSPRMNLATQVSTWPTHTQQN